MKIGPLQINFQRLGIFIIIGFVLVLVMTFNTRLGELRRITNQVATVRVQATGVMITQEVLLTQVGQATSQSAVDDYARSEAHLGKPGDNVIVVLPEPGVTPEPTPIPTPASTLKTPWDIWMALLFGE